MSSKIFAVSMSSLPFSFERTRGNTTLLDCGGFRRRRSSPSTPRRISSLTDLFSRAAVDLSSRYRASGISTVVRILTFCHIYGCIKRLRLVFEQIQRSLQFQFQFGAFWQIDFVAAARFHYVRRDRPRGRPFRAFLLVSV